MAVSRGKTLLILLILSLLIGGCSTIPALENRSADNTIPSVWIQTVSPGTIQPTTPSAINLPESDEILFTIPNTETWSGKEGDPRPGWKGWGAETFTIAPDGSFWIVDTALSPNRLLHFSPQGQFLDEIPLGEQVVYTYDLLVTKDSLWVLDISAEQPKVVQLNLVGDFLRVMEIDRDVFLHEGEFIFPGLFNIMRGEQGQLLASGLTGYVEIMDAEGVITNQPIEDLSYFGNTFREGIYDPQTGRLPVFINGKEIIDDPDFITGADSILGFNPDGSIVLAGYVLGPDQQADYLVRYYDAEGNLLGQGRQHPQTFYKDWNHHLAIGTDGSVYQLLSNPDHSVQVVRLGFGSELPTKPIPRLSTPTYLTPLTPDETAVTDEEQARNALGNFFSQLSSGDYEEAVALFGGQMDEYMRAQLPDETLDDYWQYICSYLWCLPLAEIGQVEVVSEDEYLFYTVFVNPDGTRFEMGACCGGDPAALPPVWQFAFPVKRIDGVWKVMRAPLFTP